eukprot:TRINITY_DN64351_c0_g2_i1.p1 TRINITY_DN64351_c0_g2~~TRINITY_DN64351_c0_g2_i1.p1  ORF type:complete len:537 (-),score=149.40 TRINITY_DN64351_c0_g2_i1:65-1675(-)
MEPAGKKPQRVGLSKKAKRWDDPDSDESDAEDAEEAKEAKLERDHAKWNEDAEKKGANGKGCGDESDEDDDLRGSDSDADGAAMSKDDAWLLEDLGRRQAKAKAAPPKENPLEGLWDPLAGLAPRKKRKVEPAPTSFDALDSASKPGLAICGTTVVLHGLLKAPELNGQVATIEGPVNLVTSRCPVLLSDGSVKSLRPDNLKEVLTGAVVRLKGLQAAAELNGRIGECGKWDFKSSRYDVYLADEADGAAPKRVKEANLDFQRRFVTPQRMLSEQRRPFTWEQALATIEERGRKKWKDQLAFLKELKLPAPRLLPGTALEEFAAAAQKGGEAAKAARQALASKAMLAEKAPVDAQGKLACRLLAVSVERDACCPAGAPRDKDLIALGQACKELSTRAGGEPFYYIVPTLCVKQLACLRAAATCAWPLYVALCQALVCVDSEHRAAKTWCRIDQLVAGIRFSKPVYMLAGTGKLKQRNCSNDDAGNWLLTDLSASIQIGAPSDGHVLPAEKHLAERVASQVQKDGWKNKVRLTCYRL